MGVSSLGAIHKLRNSTLCIIYLVIHFVWKLFKQSNGNIPCCCSTVMVFGFLNLSGLAQVYFPLTHFMFYLKCLSYKLGLNQRTIQSIIITIIFLLFTQIKLFLCFCPVFKWRQPNHLTFTIQISDTQIVQFSDVSVFWVS